jgi:hypothetical protein
MPDTMWTYDEGWINSRVGPTFLALYQQAGRLIDDDPGYAVWPSRVLADIYSVDMDPEASLAKHAAECAAELGITGA